MAAVRPAPWLVGFSLLTAPYGAWSFDLVLLLVPVLAVAARVAHSPKPVAVAVGALWLAGVNAVSLAMMLGKAGNEWYVWVTPWVLLGSVVVIRLTEPTPSRVPHPVGA